jgi:hypothetical protein
MGWVILGGAAICGLIGTYVAVERNRSPIEGSVLGFLLGPIGVLVVALMPIGAPKPAEQVDDDDVIDEQIWDVSEVYQMPKIKP